MSNLRACLTAHHVATVLAHVAVLVPFDLALYRLISFASAVRSSSIVGAFIRVLLVDILVGLRSSARVLVLFIVAASFAVIFNDTSSSATTSARLHTPLFDRRLRCLLFSWHCRNLGSPTASSSAPWPDWRWCLLLFRFFLAFFRLSIALLLAFHLLVTLGALGLFIFVAFFLLILVFFFVLRLGALVVLYNRALGGPLASSGPIKLLSVVWSATGRSRLLHSGLYSSHDGLLIFTLHLLSLAH